MGAFSKRVATAAAANARQDAADRKQFPRSETCHDCAFAPGSPERADPETWAALLAQADPDSGTAFHCHVDHDGNEMPIDEDGNYVPPLREDGSPLGFPICAGWIKVFDVKLERLRERS